MNTHDIELPPLPPLPEARIVSYQTDGTMRSMELRTYSGWDMKDYARAAVAAQAGGQDAINAKVAAEYGRWIRAHAEGRDYDDFLAGELAARAAAKE